MSSDIPVGEKTILGHPRGLVVLFFTEMWERFSYYGMRALLTLYLVQHFLYSDEKAGVIYGAYISLVYVMSVVGGVLSDKYLGQRKAVTFGAILLVLGHFGMAFEGSGSKEYISFNGAEYVMEDQDRDKFRKLYLDYEGEKRRVVFDSQNYAEVTGLPGGMTKLEPMSDDGDGNITGDYRIDKTSRTIFQKVCATISLGCAGPEPTTTMLWDGKSYDLKSGSDKVMEDGKEVEKKYLSTNMNGSAVKIYEKTDTDLVILETATEITPEDIMLRAKGDDAANVTEFARIKHKTYETRNEKQALYLYILFLSLSLIIAGVGFLKPNISTIVGDLYEKYDQRRDSGFTLFYMGINLGSFLSTWTCGILGIYWGWAWGFGLAGIGMVAGLLTFLFLQDWLEGKAEPPNPAKLKEKAFGPVNFEWMCYLIGFGVVAFAMTLVMHAEYVGKLGIIAGVAMFLYLIWYSFAKLRGSERSRLWAATYFAMAQIPFWSLFEQAGSSLTLFTSRLVDTNILGWNVPTPVFQSLNAGFIFIFAPIVAWLWIWMAKKKIEPSTPVKFAFGVMGAGLGYMALVGGINATGSSLLTPVFFIFAIYWIHTMAELLLSPVGLSAMTKLAPAQAVGLVMGAWFVYSGLGNLLSGTISAAAGADTIGGEIIDKVAAKENYTKVFSGVGWIGIAIGFAMLLFSPVVKKWMAEADIEDDREMDAVGNN